MTILVVAVVLALATGLYVLVVQWRHPPIGRFLDCDGVRLHYIARGPNDGPPLVLLHGNGAMLQDFLCSGIVDLAARKYRVLCFDRPGFGHSTRPRLRAWTPDAQAALFARALAELGVREPIVLGHSWGTLVALALAHRMPVKALVLAAGYYFPTRRKDVWLMSGLAVPVLGDLFAWTIAPLLSALVLPTLLRLIFAPRPVAEAFRHGFPLALVLRPRSLQAASEESAVMVPAAAALAARHAALTCPVALLAGDGDRVIEHDQPQRLQKLLPRAVLRTVSNSGHMLHYTAPERVLDAIDLMHAWPATGHPA